MEHQQDPWLTARQAAEHLGLSLKALYCRISMRQIPFCRLAGSLRFRRSELDRFLEQNAVAPVKAGRNS
ncbi:MAG: helix-turn-helix domain-containing protein [Candidatus Coatesbacteria bacterium]|nr:helix-turn-helix domain-containing protein [Candidatus Coatesbacteria bacterium]